MKLQINTSKVMDPTGERMIPESANSYIYWEHLYRYAFACKKIKNMCVLDIASGEGYGSYSLSKVAKSVIGVDINPDAVQFAREKYGLDYRVGSAECIPLNDASIDAIISFETIEHVPNPNLFIREAFRVLKPGGLFIISTPNKEVFLKDEEPNPYHCSELTKFEFESILIPYFNIQSFHGQVFPNIFIRSFQKVIRNISKKLADFFSSRVEKVLWNRFLPERVTNNEQERQLFIEKIHTLSPPLSNLWNPFCIRELKGEIKDQPTYYIAVATRRDLSI